MRASGPIQLPPRNAPKTAIATIWDGDERLACGVPLWCLGARQLVAVIPRSEIVLLSEAPSEDCPEATVVWSAETAAAARAYVARHKMRRSETPVALLKFAMFSLDRFDLVLQVDVDADLVPSYHPFRLPIWQKHVEALMASQALFVGVPDHASPVNGGLWLAKPRRWLYREALSLLRNCSFSYADGFNGVGAPRSLSVDVRGLELGAGGGQYASDLLHGLQMFTQNDWKFTGGSLDQGLLFYLLYLRHGVGTWATSASMRDRRDLWKVSHFWGPLKPWREQGKARANYLRRLGAAYLNASQTQTACARELRARAAALRREGAWERDDKLGWIPHEMPVLPSLDVVHFEARIAPTPDEPSSSSPPPPPPPPPSPRPARAAAAAASAGGIAAADGADADAQAERVAPRPRAWAATMGCLLGLGCAVKALVAAPVAVRHVYAPVPQDQESTAKAR